MNVLDDPRTNAFQDQLKLVNDGISAIISSMENKKLVLGQHRDAANRLELEFAGMKGNIKAQSGRCECECMKNSHIYSPIHTVPFILALQEQITAEKQAVAACEAELADLQKRVTEMRGVLVALEPSANASPAAFSSEQLDRQKKVQLEINAVEAQLEQEMEKQREIRKVLDGLRKGTGDPSASVDANADGANSTMVASTITTPVKEQPTTTLPTRQLFGTRVEREMQLIMLRKRLENERQQTERLREIAEIARKEVARAMELAALPRSQDDLRRNGRAVVPEWIQLLNAHSNKSADIRKMAKNKAESAVGLGSVMSFSEKLLFFTSSQSNLADTKNNGK